MTHCCRSNSRCSTTSRRGPSTTSPLPGPWRHRTIGSTAAGGSASGVRSPTAPRNWGSPTVGTLRSSSPRPSRARRSRWSRSGSRSADGDEIAISDSWQSPRSLVRRARWRRAAGVAHRRTCDRLRPDTDRGRSRTHRPVDGSSTSAAGTDPRERISAGIAGAADRPRPRRRHGRVGAGARPAPGCTGGPPARMVRGRRHPAHRRRALPRPAGLRTASAAGAPGGARRVPGLSLAAGLPGSRRPTAKRSSR